jgi:Holliday junction DNA helicase RuvB
MPAVNFLDDDPFRPDNWSAYVGQEQLKSTLKLHCDASLKRIEPLNHVFLGAPPGVGKTTLAHLIAEQMGDPIVSLTMPVRKMAIFRVVREHVGVLFLDELHRSSKRDLEDLLTLLEDGYIQLENGGKVHNKWLTVVAATTEPQLIIPTVLERFQIRPHFEDYSDVELVEIVRGMAERIGVDLSDDIVEGLGVASGGVPRQARNLVATARDLVTVNGTVTLSEILEMKQLTSEGLTRDHVNYLNLLYSQDGRAGISTLSNILRLHPNAVSNLERLLIMREYIVLTPKGRELSVEGYKQVQQQNG